MPDEASIVTSDAIKTMDFSLPSSYDTISDSKAKAVGLSEQYVPENNAPPGVSRKKPKEPKASPGESPMSAVLPSMSKSTSKASKSKAPPAPRTVPNEKEEQEPTVETMDLSLPSYSNGSGKGKNMFSL